MTGCLLRKERMTWVAEAGSMRRQTGIFDADEREVSRHADAVSLTRQRTRRIGVGHPCSSVAFQ